MAKTCAICLRTLRHHVIHYKRQRYFLESWFQNGFNDFTKFFCNKLWAITIVIKNRAISKINPWFKSDFFPGIQFLKGMTVVNYDFGTVVDIDFESQHNFRICKKKSFTTYLLRLTTVTWLSNCLEINCYSNSMSILISDQSNTIYLPTYWAKVFAVHR